MLRVALCDDDALQRATIEAHLQSYAAQRAGLAVKLSSFSSAEDVLNAEAKGEPFDLYLLDILMPGMTGIELGIRLRELGRTGVIIYLTISPEYAVDAYDTRAFHYLLKLVDRECLYQVLDSAADEISQQRSASVTVKTKEGLRLVRLDRLQYVELAGRSACYHLSSHEKVESVTMRASFQAEMAPLLAHPGFSACGASFVVNFYYVTAVEKRFLVLEDGERVPLARGLVTQVRQQWNDYWLNSPRHMTSQ